MDVKRVLQELSAIPEQKVPVASVYLDTRRQDEHARQAVRVLVHDEARRAFKAQPTTEAQSSIRTTLEPIESYVVALLRQQVDEQARGVAIFSCGPIGLFRVVTSRVPFVPMQFILDKRPRLLPFVRTCATFPPVLVAAVDSEGGYLYEVQSGELDIESHIHRSFPGRHKRGGWSQRRLSQHLGQLRQRNLAVVAEALTKVADVLLDARIVVARQAFVASEFEEHLPARIVERIVARIPFPAGLPENELREALLAAAQEQLEQDLRRRRVEARERILAEVARNGLGVAGQHATLLALNEGRVNRLLIDADFRGLGWRCRSCAALGEGAVARCEYCNGEVDDVDLDEEIVRRAVEGDAEIGFLPYDERLPTGLGVAASLRHRKTLATELGSTSETSPQP